MGVLLTMPRGRCYRTIRWESVCAAVRFSRAPTTLNPTDMPPAGMPTESIVVGIDRDGQTERVPIEAERVEKDRDGTVRCYEGDTEIATFYDAKYAVRAENLQG